MDEIFNLVGRLIKEFQELENNLALLVYLYNCKQKGCMPSGFNKDGLKIYFNLSEATLGRKLKEIREMNMFEDEYDFVVLNFLKDKRNYIVHTFFSENKLSSNAEMNFAKEQLNLRLKEAKLVSNAIDRMIHYYYLS